MVTLILSVSSISSVLAEETAEQGKPLSPQEEIEKDLALFWGSKREVKVVQRRSFVKEGKMEATLGGGLIPNDDFLLHSLVSARFGYYFTESMMVEGSFTYAMDSLTGLSSYLVEEEIGLKEVKVREYINFFYNVSLLWSPIYGKISILGKKLAHFDMYTGMGIGMIHAEGYEKQNNPDRQPQVKPMANAILGFRWHLTDMFSLRTEYRHYIYNQIGGGGVSTPIALNLAVSATF
jgi:outer membrane beta-barrel protein